jgi:hypothetical protein
MESLIFLSYIFLSGARNDDQSLQKNHIATDKYFQTFSRRVVTRQAPSDSRRQPLRFEMAQRLRFQMSVISAS